MLTMLPGFALPGSGHRPLTGSVVDSGGATLLIAREFRRGTKVLRLRDEQGVPLWAGGARRQ
jgi:hypothetical protein